MQDEARRPDLVRTIIDTKRPVLYVHSLCYCTLARITNQDYCTGRFAFVRVLYCITVAQIMTAIPSHLFFFFFCGRGRLLVLRTVVALRALPLFFSAHYFIVLASISDPFLVFLVIIIYYLLLRTIALLVNTNRIQNLVSRTKTKKNTNHHAQPQRYDDYLSQ